MKIILSPAKQMKTADDDLAYRDLPLLIEQVQELLDHLRNLDEASLQKMWNCSDRIAQQNIGRLREMDLHGRLSPALFSYTGLAYQHMAPGAMTEKQLEYLQEHLFILSGFYGILRPFDGITPYRLEMQSILPGIGDLYGFWKDRLYRAVTEEDHVIINLASKEYADAVAPFLKEDDRMIQIVFGMLQNGKVIQKGTLAKMSRGEMVYWIAENRIEEPEELKKFNAGCAYSEEYSSADTWVYLYTDTGEDHGRKKRNR